MRTRGRRRQSQPDRERNGGCAHAVHRFGRYDTIVEPKTSGPKSVVPGYAA
jgi:hypothetical protein